MNQRALLTQMGRLNYIRLVGDLNRNHGITVVVIDHDLHAVLPYANRMALMVNGEIVCDSDVSTTLEYMYNHDIYVVSITIRIYNVYGIGKGRLP